MEFDNTIIIIGGVCLLVIILIIYMLMYRHITGRIIRIDRVNELGRRGNRGRQYGSHHIGQYRGHYRDYLQQQALTISYGRRNYRKQMVVYRPIYHDYNVGDDITVRVNRWD